jgi:hypothetical protein
MKKGDTVRLLNRVVSFLLLLQIINISIDPIDPISIKLGRLTAQEDLSINDIESIYEFISEQCLGVDVPEQDEDDENALIKAIDIYISQSGIQITNEYRPHIILFYTIDKNLNSIVLDLSSPPPKA